MPPHPGPRTPTPAPPSLTQMTVSTYMNAWGYMTPPGTPTKSDTDVFPERMPVPDGVKAEEIGGLERVGLSVDKAVAAEGEVVAEKTPNNTDGCAPRAPSATSAPCVPIATRTSPPNELDPPKHARRRSRIVYLPVERRSRIAYFSTKSNTQERLAATRGAFVARPVTVPPEPASLSDDTIALLAFLAARPTGAEVATHWCILLGGSVQSLWVPNGRGRVLISRSTLASLYAYFSGLLQRYTAYRSALKHMVAVGMGVSGLGARLAAAAEETTLALRRLTFLVRALVAVERRTPPSATLAALAIASIAATAAWVLPFVAEPVPRVVREMRPMMRELRRRIVERW